MTRTDADQISRRADDLRELHPTHGIAGDLRAANARLRHDGRRCLRAADIRPAPGAETVDAAFARMFGEG